MEDSLPSTSGRSHATFSSVARHSTALDHASLKDLVAQWPTTEQLPIVYHDKYNITFMGIEKLHPFDSCKFRKVIASLEGEKLITHKQLVTPLEATMEALADVHTQEYLHLIHTSNLKIVQVTELAPLYILPTGLLRWKVISPMKHHVAGTMLAAALAVERGWAVNVGGGMHHAYASNGMGWCPFDDIMLAVRRVRKASGGRVQRVLYIDLDAHQGNGVERDKLALKDGDVFVVDVYNARVFPKDGEAKPAIDVDIPLNSGVEDAAYLSSLTHALERAAAAFPEPDLVFYNAGTDILEGDPLGRMSVSQAGVLQRDAMVWDYALHTAKAPIVMTLSGGYAKQSAPTIAASLASLLRRFNLVPTHTAAESAAAST